MQKFTLDKTQLSLLVFDNRYEVDEKTKFLSRCIDGRYDRNVIPAKAGIQNKIDSRLRGNDNLPALAFPGADAGELALILATGRSFGFAVDPEKAYKSLIETVGGEKNIRLHTDSHATPKVAAGGCGHLKQINLDPAAYNLEKADLDFIKEKLVLMKKKGAVEEVLHGDHGEGAVVYIKGNYGIYPQYLLKTEDVEAHVQIFVYHQSLVDGRHRVLAKNLLKNKAVKLPENCDEEYLYDALSDTAEVHTLETAKRLAKDLPIFQVIFDEEGMFSIKEMGVV